MVHDFESLYCQSKVGPGEALIYAHFLGVSLFKKLFFCLWFRAVMVSKF